MQQQFLENRLDAALRSPLYVVHKPLHPPVPLAPPARRVPLDPPVRLALPVLLVLPVRLASLVR